MHRSLPALLVLTLAACSSGGSSTTNGPTGNGNSTGVSNASGTANGTGATTTGGGANGTTNGGNGTTNGGNGTTNGGNGGITVNNFNQVFNDAVCNFENNCEGAVPEAPYLTAYCALGVTFLDLGDLPLAVDAGRVGFDPAQAATCINGLQSGQCSLPAIFPCIPFLSGLDGLVAPAGTCYANGDCLSAGCTGNTPATCSPGTCAGLVAVGGACGCPNCGNCDPDGGLSCVNSVCTAAQSVGQPCNDGTHAGCQIGLDCVNDVCAALPVSAGNPCNTHEGECVSGNYCFEALGASNGNCANQVAAGQPCGQDPDHQEAAFRAIDTQCAGAHPVCLGAGTLMDSGVQPGVCATVQDVGGSCTPPSSAIDTGFDYNNGCYLGLNCVSGACAKPPSSGPCSTGTIACDPTVSFCAGATNTCTPFIAPGGTCDPNDPSPCGPTKSCDNTNHICVGSLPACSPRL